jgi:general secretion pathway protein J
MISGISLLGLWAKKRSGGAAGFTVVELLVVLTLLAFIMTLVFSGLSLGTKVWESSNVAAEKTYRMQSLQRALGDMIYLAFPLQEQRDADAKPLFEGTRDRVFFAASLPPYPNFGGLHLVTLQIVKDRGETRLHLTRLPYAPGSARTSDDPEFTEVIFSGTEQLAFSYRSSIEGSTDNWESDWHEDTFLPNLVRIEFLDRETRANSWPDLVFPIAINAEAACITHDISGLCRWREK